MRPETHETEPERFARKFLVNRLELSVRKIPEDPPKKTADFEVSRDGAALFVAEVKNLTDRELVFRDDNGPMRVSRLIVAGAKQLAGYADPKVLIIVNDEPGMSAEEDFKLGFNGGGPPELGHSAPRQVRRDLAWARTIIDLYVWIERQAAKGKRDLWVTSASQRGRELRNRFFRGHEVRPLGPTRRKASSSARR